MPGPLSPSPPRYEHLVQRIPETLRRWQRVGIVVTGLGYALATLVLVLDSELRTQETPTSEPLVVAACAVAAVLHRRRRLTAASAVLLAAIWIEVHTTLLVFGTHPGAAGILPALSAGAILFLGPRIGVACSFFTLLTVPLSVFVGGWLGIGPGFARRDSVALIGIEGGVLGVTLLLSRFTNAFLEVLIRSEHSRRRARDLIDGSPDALVVLAPNGEVVDCNSKARQLLGSASSPQSADTIPSGRFLRCVETGKLRSLHDLGTSLSQCVLEPTGQILETTSCPVMRDNGSEDVLIVLRDVTTRQRAEKQAQQLQERLQHSQKLEALGRLAGGIAHDFNNLLMVVGGHGTRLQAHADPEVSKVGGHLQRVQRNAGSLTQQLLSFARRGTEQPEVMDLAETIESMSHLLTSLLGRDIQLELSLQPRLTIYADPAQIEQVVLNLAINARDAMGGGGRLRVTCQHYQQRVELVVSDNGEGMAPDTQQRAFEPFFTTKPKGVGTGLGLSLVHGIVQASGGRIELTSRPGEGTTFTLSWPLHQSSNRPPHTPPNTYSASRLETKDQASP